MEDAAAPHVQAAYRYLSRSGRGRSSHCEPAKHEVPTHLPSTGFIGREDAEGLARSHVRVRTFIFETAASVVSAGGGPRHVTVN